MNTSRNSFVPKLLASLTLVTASLGICQEASAAEYFLWAGKTSLTLPNGVVVPMWGYAQEADKSYFSLEGVPSVPGPALTVAPGDTTLTVHLLNRDIPQGISLYIPTLYTPLQPVFITDSTGRRRVQSLAPETAMGSVTTYTWTNVTPGTYLYQSGSRPAVQVQMGLYGAVKASGGNSQAYPGIAYDREATLLYSELDTALHAAVNNGTYGTPAYPSAFEYHPQYFLVNGKPFQGSDAPTLLGQANDRVLLRFLNAGLKSHAPMLLNQRLSVIAEDGARYPFQKDLATFLLAPGMTIDAMFYPVQEGQYALFDRMNAVSDAGVPNGGLISRFEVGDNGGAPIAQNDTFVTSQNQVFTANAPGVLGNDSDPNGDALSAQLLETVSHGSLTLGSDGRLVYTPTSGYVGVDQFTYRVQAGGQNSNTATVVIYVERRNSAPVANNDAYRVAADKELAVAAPGVLTNDTDRDGDALQANLESNPTLGAVVLDPNGALQYTPFGDTGVDHFRYTATDGLSTSAEATVSVTIDPPTNLAPVAKDDTFSMKKNTVVSLAVLANDSDSDGFVEPSTVTIVNAPSHGTTVVKPDGTIQYTPTLNYRGTEVFTYLVYDNDGTASNVATVRVNVTK